ncbi:MAG: hypothetical protein AB7J28_02425 [Hyphomonadaceae bacterium]
MQAVQMRLIAVALWPLAIWTSLTHLDEHPADDYVEMTSPIVAVAVGFWIVAASLTALWFANGPRSIWDVLLVFLPVIYLIGMGLYWARENKFPR